MKKARMVLILSLWVAVLPFLGFPYAWKDIIFTVSGLLLTYLSFLLYREMKLGKSGENVFENFSENR